MPSSLSAFDHLRTSFVGPNDTIKCIDVDIAGDRVYAATLGNGVYVWELFQRRQLALMHHPDWVNAVRCYPPPANTARNEDGSPGRCISVLEYLRDREANAMRGRGSDENEPVPVEKVLCEPPIVTEWVLTGCEDGVVSAWCPVTFRIRSQCKPTEGPITQLVLAKGPQSAEAAHSSPPRAEDENPVKEKTDLEAMPGALFLCYAVSLENIFVLRVRSGLQCIHYLSHPEICTAVDVLTTPFLRYLLVGQESGSIKCWSLSGEKFEYQETLHYPAGELDVDEDATKSVAIHVPHINIRRNIVANTFAYNVRRNADPSDPGIRLTLDEQRFQYEMRIPASIPWGTLLKGSHASALQKKISSEPSEAHMKYDQRRITCLATGKQYSELDCRFFSGHAMGEVLVWEKIVDNQPILLLKKIKLFDSPQRWVWNLQAIEVSVPSVWFAKELSIKKKKPKKGTSPPASHLQEDIAKSDDSFLFQLVVWADDGQIVYLQVGKSVLKTNGPGFLATASYCYAIENPPKDSTGEKRETKVTPRSKIRVSGTALRLPLLVRGKDTGCTKGHITSQYFIIMGNAEGRLEQFNVSSVVAKLLHTNIKA